MTVLGGDHEGFSDLCGVSTAGELSLYGCFYSSVSFGFVGPAATG